MARTSRFAQQCQQGMQMLSLVLIGVLLYKICSSMKSTFPASDQPDTDDEIEVEEEEEE